ncbi:MAG: ribulose-phosphate 3-epimerase [Bacteroidetes bacterium RIFCSPLOWO2_02_FULL_36_8]|nr:MAG: ribulose-phosphate 3-epimerase [Bacteroidetes bacterium RIFCSPLOWO2_02_FULL_36_8]OFY69658.1 MAG: ribulose-phosphate 3-epimerase [Bacteroidetes bacterium RIFCSPLOWO2_12_FULL_37_12]
MPLLSPSLLAGDFSNLQKEVEMLNWSKADWIHLDIMDGVFVPNISFGLPVVSAVKKHSRKPLDVHLMIVEPDRYIDEFKKAGAEILTVHYEACTHLHRTIQKINDSGMKAGVAINPHTPVESLIEILPNIYLVCLMSVNPGFYGQKFIPSSLHKIEKLKKIINEQKLSVLIEVDGGVSEENAASVVGNGANILVAGNLVFKNPDPLSIINWIKNL